MAGKGVLVFCYCIKNTMTKATYKNQVFNWVYNFRGIASMMVEKSHGGRTAESSHLDLYTRSREHTGNGRSVGNLKACPQ